MERCTCRVEWNGSTLEDHERGCPWYESQEAEYAEQERLQLLEAFDWESVVRPEHFNAIVQELLSLRARLAALESDRLSPR